MTKPPHSLAYRPDIDGLRALAVLAVIGFHASPRLVPGGFVGVDVFFVISGFLISSIILNDLRQERFSFAEFYARRVNRIFPSLVVVLLSTWLVGWLVLFADEFRMLGKHMAASSVFLSNVVLWRESGYFDLEAHAKPLLHLWSLAVEEQYYLFWPLILVVFWRRKASIAALITTTLLISFSLNIAGMRSDGALTFYLPHSRLWELLCGAALAYLGSDGRAAIKGRLPNEAAAVLGVALIGYSIFGIDGQSVFPGWWALAPVAGAFLLIMTGAHAPLVYSIMSHRALVFTGLISYPLYLWHWPLLWYANTVEVGYASIALRLAAIAAAFALAWLTYRFVETPIRVAAANGRRASVQLSLASLLTAMGLLGLATFKFDGFGRNGAGELVKDVSPAAYQAARGQYSTCDPMFLGSRPPEMCLASRQGAPRAAVVGDSHADHLFPGLAKRDANGAWLLLGEGSCPFALGVRSHGGGVVDKCAESNERIMGVLKELSGMNTVVLASMGPFYFSGIGFAPEHLGPGPFNASRWKFEPVEEVTGRSRAQTFADGYDRTITALEGAGKRVVFYLDIPELNFSPRECVARPFRSVRRTRCAIDKKLVLSRQKEYRGVVESLAKKHPNLQVFDPLKNLCDERECAVSGPGAIFYRDGHHLSARGSEHMAGPFLAWLESRRVTDR